MLRYIAHAATGWGIVGLILLTPVAVGSVEAWAFASMEAVIFLMMAWSLLRYLVVADGSRAGIDRLVVVGGLFVAFVAFEMVPLPPSIERTISPSTFDLYQNSMPGWPDQALDDRPLGDIASTRFALLPTSAEIGSGASIPFAVIAKQTSHPTAQELGVAGKRVWRPLSLGNSITGPALLKLLAYLCLFAVILSYPSTDNDGLRFFRMLVSAILVAGVLAAVAALLGRLWPNGKVLWVYTPYDWPHGNPWGLRATGTFANPDHLADYLDMVLPLALTGFLRPSVLASRRLTMVRLFCGGAVILTGSSLLLTSSRAGWLGALIGLALLAELWRKRQRTSRTPHVPRFPACASLGLLVLSVLLVVGPGGRKQTDLRLGQAVGQSSIVSRLEPARLSLNMIRDFPMFGTGLGCWPEVFPHYARPPWSPIFWNATHNDYVQLGCETGLIGFGLVAWFFAGIVIRVWRGTQRLKHEHAVLTAAAVAALSAVGVHEFFDFSLQIPANALLFTVVLGIAARFTKDLSPQMLLVCASHSRLFGAIALVGAMALIPIALTQTTIPYPYNIQEPATLNEAYSLANAHPANATVHLMIARLLDDGALANYRVKELRSALWLEPINPFARDIYAQTLVQLGKRQEAFDQVSLSVSSSPMLSSHWYLQPRIIPWLSAMEQRAIERGFRSALANGYKSAVPNFAKYYDFRREFLAEADCYYEAATKGQDPILRAEYFVNAGTAYVKAGELHKAESSFLAACAETPEDSEPYEQLVRQVFGPEDNFSAAKTIVARGIKKGADPFNLYLVLGLAAQQFGNNVEAEAALRQALAMRPSSVEALVGLGDSEPAANNFDRAAHWLRMATNLSPSSADAFYDLGLANEGAYEYFCADLAFQRALALAPANQRFKEHYAEFRQKIIRNLSNTPKP
ncbi:MAG: O-antigen ligase family protein [Deltaproteobacteria bacterium]|nr:O-antigen ligase family protein [Deltaproteobacteria bacterium]